MISAMRLMRYAPRAKTNFCVDVIGTDTSGDRELEVGCLGEALSGQVCGPERLQDHDLGVRELPFENRVGALLVRGDDQGMTLRFEEGP